MGLDIYLEHRFPCAEEPNFIETVPSAKYPDHLFKIGYFRSSYNDSGTNKILNNLTGWDLYKIFHAEPGRAVIDWQASLARAKEVIVALDKVRAESGDVKVEAMAPGRLFRNPVACTPNEALTIYTKQVKGHRAGNGFDSFSCSQGEFFLGEPMEVRAFIEGTNDGKPCFYVVMNFDMSWYRQALEIIVETIEWVLAQPDPDEYGLYFSG